MNFTPGQWPGNIHKNKKQKMEKHTKTPWMVIVTVVSENKNNDKK